MSVLHMLRCGMAGRPGHQRKNTRGWGRITVVGMDCRRKNKKSLDRRLSFQGVLCAALQL
jgi:hypothetical protein